MIKLFGIEIEFWSQEVPPEQSLFVSFLILMIGITFCHEPRND